MVLLPGDLIHAVLQTLEATPRQLSVLNGLKAVSKQWLWAVRRVLRERAGSRGMLELFRHDCVHDARGLALPLHCRISPYASTAGLTVQSAVDGAGVLERSVEAVLWAVRIDAEACCPYSMWGSAGAPQACAWHDDECPCTWHFEEVRADTHDPGFCLAKAADPVGASGGGGPHVRVRAGGAAHAVWGGGDRGCGVAGGVCARLAAAGVHACGVRV
jgi:hypothetical protein